VVDLHEKKLNFKPQKVINTSLNLTKLGFVHKLRPELISVLNPVTKYAPKYFTIYILSASHPLTVGLDT
jgi:hypothetical protein